MEDIISIVLWLLKKLYRVYSIFWRFSGGVESRRGRWEGFKIETLEGEDSLSLPFFGIKVRHRCDEKDR